MNIIINGGTRGIGRETALLFSEDPSNSILVTGRNAEALNKLKDNAMHHNIHVHQTEMTRFEEKEAAFLKAAGECFRELDILINNAGSLVHSDFIDFSIGEARKLMEVNFLGPASVIRLLKPMMKRGSHIVNISSMGGFQGSSKYRGMSYYSASKAAISCLSECLAGEFSEAGISVNCLALGAVQTEMFEEAFPGLKAPVSARDMAVYIAGFAVSGNRYFNGKVIPVAFSDP